jgi:leader peptidase (prepilin peptidase)/N-methyltransferase
VVSFIDIDYHAIPAYLCLLGIVVGLVFSIIESGGVLNVIMDLLRLKDSAIPLSPFAKSFGGLLFGLGFIYLFKLFGDVFISLLLHFRKKESIEGEKESLGLGDVDFMGMVGVFLGVKGVILVFFLAPFIAVGYSIFALIFKKSHLIPYLPYLSLATIIVFFWGNKILSFIF